jgi:hypothetical protein
MIPRARLFQRGRGGCLALVGFLLSPLSWWNDIFVNFPIAYAIAMLFGIIDTRLFQPVFILAYWGTNVVGFILLQKGAKLVLNPDDYRRGFQEGWHSTLKWGTIYTLLVVVLILTGVLEFPF